MRKFLKQARLAFELSKDKDLEWKIKTQLIKIINTQQLCLYTYKRDRV